MPRKKLPVVKLDTAIQEFFKMLEPEKMAKNTLENKKRTLEKLKRTAGGSRALTRHLTVNHFDDCIANLSKTRSPGSLKVDRVCLKQFAEFCKRRGWVNPSFDPVYRITKSSQDNPGAEKENLRRRRRVPGQHWSALLDATEHPRDRMVVAAGLHWGCRGSTTVAIQFKDIDLTEGASGLVELFNVKKRSVYIQPIGVEMLPELTRYLDWYRATYGELQPQWYLTPSKKPGFEGLGRPNLDEWPLIPDKPMDARLVWVVVKKALRGIGWTEEQLIGEGGHTLRRSGGQEVERRGGDPTALMAFYGHKSPEMSLHYTGNLAGLRRLTEIKTTPPAPREPEPEPEPEPTPAPDPAQQLAKVYQLADFRRAV